MLFLEVYCLLVRERLAGYLEKKVKVLVQSLSRAWLFATAWIAAHQASLSITNSRSLLKLMSIESVQFSGLVMSDSADPMDCSTPGLPVHH